MKACWECCETQWHHYDPIPTCNGALYLQKIRICNQHISPHMYVKIHAPTEISGQKCPFPTLQAANSTTPVN